MLWKSLCRDIMYVRNVFAFTDATYYGKLIGELSGDGQGAATGHDVSGKVYAIDDRTLWIRDFTFDGNAPGRLK